MTGQPSDQITHEAGADGELPAFSNGENSKHMREPARRWYVEVDTLPHWAEPSHPFQILRYREQLSIRMLWVQRTNPAVSLPHLGRIRSILASPDLFLVVQDAYLTETAEFATVVLPAAVWSEKAGTFTNVDRTRHISQKAVESPGEARSDFDIFPDYVRRVGFRDKDGAPGGARAALHRQDHCDGCRHCVSCGKDLVTGANLKPAEYKAMKPEGRALHKAAHDEPRAKIRTPTTRSGRPPVPHPDQNRSLQGAERRRAGRTGADPTRGRRRHRAYTVQDGDLASKQPHHRFLAVRISRVEARTTPQPDEQLSKAQTWQYAARHAG